MIFCDAKMLRYASESGGDTFTVWQQSNPIGWAADVTYSVLSSQLQKLLELNISRATWVRRKLKLKMPCRLISPTSGSILGFRSRYRTMVKKLQTKQTVCKHCKTRLPYTMSNTSNMMCHLKRHHNNKLLQTPATKWVKEGQTSIQRSFAATWSQSSAKAQEITRCIRVFIAK